MPTKHWTLEHVKALVKELPDLLTMTEPGKRAKLIWDKQGDILGVRLSRPRDSLHMSLYPGKRLHRMLDEIRDAAAAVVEEPVASPMESEPKKARHVVRLRMPEWTALAHHELVKPLLDKKAFCTPNQLIGVLERAQKDVLPEDRWRDQVQWHSAIYRTTRNPDGGKRDALSMLREGIKYQPIAQFVKKKKAEPEPVVAEPEKNEEPKETVMNPVTATATWHPTSDATIVQAMVTLFGALQARTEAAMAPVLERLGQLETFVRALPADVRAQVADVVGGEPTPKPHMPTDIIQVPVYEPERLPRVDVVGLLGNQAEVVKRACGRQWNLRFLSAEEVERQPVTAPDAIMLRKFVSHSAQERIRKAGANLHYANGAAESVIAQLNKLSAARLN